MAPRQSSWEVAIRSSRSQHLPSNANPTQDDDSNGGPRDAKEAKAFWVSEVGKLSPEHRAHFLRCAPRGTYEEYVTMLTQSVGDTVNASKVAKLSRKMKPVFQLSNLIAPILSSATQANPMPASIILGGITCILSLTTRLDDFQTKVIETLESMCDQIQLVNDRQPESPTDNDAHVLACGVEVATDVFNFCTKVAKLFYDENGKEKSSFVLVLRTFGKDFDARFGDVKSSFQRHMNMWEKRRWLANQRVMESMNDEIHGIGELLRHDVYKREGLVSDQHQAGKEAERARQAEERRRFIDWLPSLNFGQIQEDNLRRCVEGSGDWLLNHKDFNAWRTGRDSNILWIHGRPGSGKSHLASRIIADFDPSKGTDNPAVAYAFCTTTQMKTEMTMNNLLSSILKQLYGQLPLSESIESLLSQFATGSRDEMQRSTMMEGIRKVISRLPSTLIIVDGLDECKDFPDKQFEDFCNFLASLAKLQGTKDAAKLLILSRRNSETIQKSLSGCKEVQIDKGASIEDIKAYISREVNDIHESPSEEERAGLEEIKTKLFSNADGNFLWVHLKTKLLREEGSVEDMKDALQDVTGGLYEIFGEELGKILSNTKEKVRLRALKALQLVTNSYRALSKKELLEALSVRPGRTSITESQRIIPSTFSTTHCADLVVEEQGFFKLRHASLKDFLSSQLPALGDYGKLQQTAHRDLAEICLTYLNFDHFGSFFGDLIDQYATPETASEESCHLGQTRVHQSPKGVDDRAGDASEVSSDAEAPSEDTPADTPEDTPKDTSGDAKVRREKLSSVRDMLLKAASEKAALASSPKNETSGSLGGVVFDDVDEPIDVFEVAWQLAHAMLGVRYTQRLVDEVPN
ncbi:Vegetative incompatibility protein HET-E-1 [Colletotrichum sidae]|uniref:Vegetative incompatibility protein HET-E-1 n=1 Tax=Colletotrichum sidae TaxID=1347389 RepID=A0A4R8TLU8_9PEZI|nr:Vegetative incompatibility protein HET-E-1 [Colletotrichum sidae]